MEIIKIDNKDARYPKRLLEIKDFPKELYVIGNMDLLQSKYTVGIVGSRNCTEYGRTVSYNFAKELSSNLVCVISGMAIGIDSMAHNGAIDEQGKTIAVLGGGFNYIYPKENEWLFHKILEKGGCIISEYSPNVEPDTKKFPKRNRIISGLSDKVLVVEAEYRSGSSITVKYARKQGKTVYAIPSNIYSYAGLGTNIMIQEGAKLVIKPNQIIQDIKNERVNKIEVNSNKIKRTEKADNCTKEENSDHNKISGNLCVEQEYLPIYELLSSKPIHINEIARKLKTTIKDITPIITVMEIKEYAFQIQTNYFIKKE